MSQREKQRECPDRSRKTQQKRDKAENSIRKLRQNFFRKAVSEKKQTEALIQRYMKEIPKQKEHVEQNIEKGDYRLILKNKKMTEENWQGNSFKLYSRQDAEEFQETVNQYRKKVQLRSGSKECPREGRNGRSDRSPGKMEQEKDLAEQTIWKQKRFIINCAWTAKTMERCWLLFHLD